MLRPILPVLLALTCTEEPPPSENPAQPTSLEASTRTSDWPQWRGPLATGEAPGADPPIDWSEEENVRWKAAVPGRGHSTPIVWKDRIFLTAAVPVGEPLTPEAQAGIPDRPGAHDNLPVTSRQRFEALALDRETGKIVWRKALAEALPSEGGHISASLASPSPATDGERLFAFFGSHGLYALDLDGKLKWKADLGTMHSKHGHGEGASPALHGDSLIVNWDHEGPSSLVVFDTRTGEERWRKARDEDTSWASPIVVEHGGRQQVVVSGTKRLRAYDLETGEVLWQCGGLSANIVASPVAGNGMVFAGSSYEKQVMLAIRLDGARGDVTGTEQVAWSRIRGTPYVPSPLLTGRGLYFLNHYQGVLTRVEPRTGRDLPGTMRLPGIRNVYASPVAAAGRVYITDRSGTTVVIDDNETPTILAVNQLDDRFNASAAVAGREIYLRGEKILYSLRAPHPNPSPEGRGAPDPASPSP